MSERIVFFDFDGVIVDSFNLAFHLMKLRESSLTASEYRDRFNENIYKHFDPGGKPESSTTSKAFRDFFGLYTPQILTLDYIQHIDEAIRSLAREYSLVINSSTPATTIRSYLTLHQLENYFTDILGPEISLSKTEKLQDYLREVHTPPFSAIFITDTLGDIREATRAQVASIGVSWGYHSKATLEKGKPLAIIEHPQDLSGTITAYFRAS